MVMIFCSLWYAFMRNEVIIDGGYLLMAKVCCVIFQLLAFSVPLEAAFISCFSHLPHDRVGFLRFLHRNRKEVAAWFGGALRHILPRDSGKDAMLLVFFLLWQSATMWMGFTVVGVAAWLSVLPVFILPGLLFVPGEAYLIVMACRGFARLAGK